MGLQPAGPDVKSMVELTEQLKELHHKVYEQLSLIDDRIKKGQMSLQDVVDIGFICREQEELLDEMRKNSKVRKEFAERTIVMKWIAASMTPNPIPEPIKATLASASNIRIKKMAELPEFGGDDYKAYMGSLGIPEEVLAKGLVKPDWEKTVEHITTLIEDGKKLPPGIGRTWNIYTCTFMRNRRTIAPETED